MLEFYVSDDRMPQEVLTGLHKNYELFSEFVPWSRIIDTAASKMTMPLIGYSNQQKNNNNLMRFW